MKHGLVIVVAARLLCGCGHASAPKDPFVGTWQYPGHALMLVIAKTSSGYLATFVFPAPSTVTYPLGPTQIALTRHGNELVGSYKDLIGGEKNEEVLDFWLTSGHLAYRATFSASQYTQPTIQFSPASASTATPTPSPS